MTDRQLDEERLFHFARKLASIEARIEYLDQICAGDQALRERVEALLAVYDQESQFLKSNPAVAATEEHPQVIEQSGQEIGRYKLLQQIGEGGFGVVYMAEQVRPVRRKVALKVIKPGMDSKAVVARFEAERQALSMMDHPNIARVFDGGATDSGRPYFVMELVRGIPITDFCDSLEMATENRLKLFIAVCQAVQHAHLKGIIHRDLKPSNILVTLHDDQPVVKVIDFGVAKAINQQLTEKTLFTTFGNMIGTPQYMSPEQAALSGLDVDTRSDIYSLGVLLYELLTGTPPLEIDRVRTATYVEIQRLIREEEPPRPSTRLSNSGKRLSQLAKHRGTTPERLRTLVRSELDWIAMKALEKDRQRRYETCNSLADDVTRYLNREPVLAYPPSVAYRMRKFVAKHRRMVIGNVVVVSALLLGLITMIVSLQRVERERADAQQAATVAEQAVEKERATMSKMNMMLVERALLQVMYGEFDGFQKTIEVAQSSTVPKDWVLTLKGLESLHRGQSALAIDFLKQAVASDSHNISAQSLLAVGYYYSGDWHTWSQHIVNVEAWQPREDWRDFDKFFLGYAYFYIDYDRAAAQFESVVNDHPNWLFARAMRATAWSHRAWMDSDTALAADAAREIERLSPFLPDTPFIQLTKYGVYIMALARGDASLHTHLKELARDAAEKLDKHPKYFIATFMRADSDISIGDEQGAARAREFLWKHASGFLLQPAFERHFAERRDSDILVVNDTGPDAQLMRAMVHAWNDRKSEAIGICDRIEAEVPTWQARAQIMWVLLLCRDLPEAQARCRKWLKLEQSVHQAMSINRESIEYLAHYVRATDPSEGILGEIPSNSWSTGHDPQVMFLRGLIAYSQSQRSRALELFRKSLADGDARFVTHFARAFRDRLNRELAGGK